MSDGRNLVAGEKIRSFVERYERLQQDKDQIGEEQKVVMAEAKSERFDPKALRYCLKVRKMSPGDFHEGRALAEMYPAALGMVPDPPLFRAANLIGCDTSAREQVIEALKRFVPDNGSITIEAGGAPVRLTRDKNGDVTKEDVKSQRPSAREDESSAPQWNRRTAVPPPQVDADGAEALGRQATHDDVPIIKNPFPFGDARRQRCDLGWRKGNGGNGMGPQ